MPEEGDLQPVVHDWDAYWRGTHESAAHADGSAQDEALERFWSSLFDTQPEEFRLLDLACGNGAVSSIALRLKPGVSSYGLDFSGSAVRALRKRSPGTSCVIADARCAPFKARAFDVVASQFGIEYAGTGAISDAARMVAGGGTLALVLHLHGGAIYQECRSNVAAISAIRDTDILATARTAFAAGYAVNAGSGSATALESAENSFVPSVRALEDVLRRFGNEIASGLAQQLYRDIAYMYQRMRAYAREDVLGWLDATARELDAYAGRMSAMLEVAIDEKSLASMEDSVVAQGLTRPERRIMRMGKNAAPGAWIMLSQRP